MDELNRAVDGLKQSWQPADSKTLTGVINAKRGIESRTLRNDALVQCREEGGTV
jgi:hypothetical protein